ncbi:MAG: hypothetical protein ACNA7Y_00170 [Gammaproteobacteria bacterium]
MMSEAEADKINSAVIPDKTVQEVLYKFLKLHERMKLDRLELAKQTEQLETAVKGFSGHVEHFAGIDERVRKALVSHIQAASKQVGAELGEEASKAAVKQVEYALDQLQRGINNTHHLLEKAVQEAKFSLLRSISIVITTGIITGLLTVWWFMPKSFITLTDEQMRVHRLGAVVYKAWPQLKKAEQDRIFKLAGE